MDDQFAAAAERILAATFGVVSFARVLRFPKAESVFPEAADALAAELAAGPAPRSFKVEARREDKSFALTSYDIAYLLGDLLRERMPEVAVDVHRPEVTVNVEVRDRIYAYAEQRRGPGGLPVGSSGRGLLLLSGGIDSPVAGYLMGGRGLALDAVYFHSYPFTSTEAEGKGAHPGPHREPLRAASEAVRRGIHPAAGAYQGGGSGGGGDAADALRHDADRQHHRR